MNHNLHMLIPIELWDQAKKVAKARGYKTMTDFVCHALTTMLENKNESSTRRTY